MSAAISSKKPKLAIFWAASCGGCEIAILDIHEQILDVAAAFDIVLWPTSWTASTRHRDDGRRRDRRLLVQRRHPHQREDTWPNCCAASRKFLVAFGSCASEGCIPGLANLTSRKDIFDTAFSTTAAPTTPTAFGRSGRRRCRRACCTCRASSRCCGRSTRWWTWTTTIPGCPPEAEQIWAALEAVVTALNGTGPLPPKGSVLGAGDSTVCDECARKRDDKKIRPVRPHPAGRQVRPGDLPARAGPALLRLGHPERLRRALPGRSSPCIGCYGPAEGVVDYGPA